MHYLIANIGGKNEFAVEYLRTRAEELRRVFGRFARGEHRDQGGDEGSGLGLSIVASIMRLHGSEVRAAWADGRLSLVLAFPSP